MQRLCYTLASMEEALTALERRGIRLKIHAERLDFETGRLPVFHVFHGLQRTLVHFTREKLDDFLQQQEQATGQEMSVDETPADAANAEAKTRRPRLHITELHEVRTINAGLKDLAELGFDIQVADSAGAHGHRRHPGTCCVEARTRFRWRISAACCPPFAPPGRKGLQVTRFKGLGEMNAEELRETTLDPANRTLIQVSMRDAGAADECSAS